LNIIISKPVHADELQSHTVGLIGLCK